MVEEKLLSQKQLAEKYDVDQATVSLALRLLDVKPAEIADTKGRKTGMYNERDAVDALVRLFEKRKDDHKMRMQEWQARIDRMKIIYVEGA